MLRFAFYISVIIIIAIFYGGDFYLRNKVIAPPQIQKHVDIFFKEAENRHTHIETFYGLTIEFSDTIKYPVAGTSYDSWNQNNKVIFINPFIWNYLRDTERTELIAHELGHSLLHRNHTSFILPDRQPYSIMYPQLFLKEVFESHKEHYWSELFSVQGDLPK